MTELVAGLVLFLGIHSISIVAWRLRDRIVRQIGRAGWQVTYSVIALVGLVLIVRGFGDARRDAEIVYLLPRWVHAVSSTLMLPVFPLLLAAYLPGAISSMVRHPMLVAIVLWALAHLLANGTQADLLLFGSFLVWAVADRISLAYRPPRPAPSLPAGPWNDPIAVVGGLVLYGLMQNVGHRYLIGVPLD